MEESSTQRSAVRTPRNSGTDQADQPGQSTLGSTTDSWRTPEAWNRHWRRNQRTLEQRLRYRYSGLKSAAARRGIAFTLTFEQFRDMWTNQAGRCAYTGQRMTLTIGRGYFWRNWSVSIDRLDPSIDRAHKNKPIQSLRERFIQLAAVKYVDEIVIYNTESDLLELLKTRHIDIRIIGSDWKNKPFTGHELDILMGRE